MPKGYTADGVKVWTLRDHSKEGRHAVPKEELLWRHIKKEGPDDCWEWTGSKTISGYGQFWNKAASRRVVLQMLGEVLLPKHIVVRHLCHNPGCCNPSHLALGTQKDNIQDRHADISEMRMGDFFSSLATGPS